MNQVFSQQEVDEIHEWNVRKEERALGREEGREEERLSTLRSLMMNMGWSAELTMEMMGVPEDERQTYADLLLQR